MADSDTGTYEITTEDVELVAADGNHFAAAVARAVGPRGPAVVILPDVRGLHEFYEDLAARFARQGYDAIAFDYFGRTAGVGKRAEDFPFMDHVPLCTVDGISADVRACVEHLRGVAGQAERNIFTMGFCFGGSNSWIMGQTVEGLAGVVGLYGHPTREGRDGSAPVIDRVQDLSVPLMGLMGGADQGIPANEVEKFDQALANVGIQYKLVTYPGAPHSFFDRHYEAHPDAAEDAWKRVLDFVWGGNYWSS
ncbi:MAG TPA: dienelactone hydrolase family protein [Dehalococcoidia bacterium]|jgi:carboxymethylenebutenolidase|nr:dienelactone hydrolase family protein [Dehalococcoidia bacterium]